MPSESGSELNAREKIEKKLGFLLLQRKSTYVGLQQINLIVWEKQQAVCKGGAATSLIGPFTFTGIWARTAAP